MQLEKIAELQDGYGRRVAFAHDGRTWAAATESIVHIWDDLELRASAPSPGELLDGVRFSADGSLLVSPHILDPKSGEWASLPPLDEALHVGLDDSAEPDSFAAHAGAWGPDERTLVLYAEYRPPRGLGSSSSYSGPDKRLLLLDGRLREVLGVLWEGKGWESYRAIALDERTIAAGAVGVAFWRLGNQEPAGETRAHNAVVREIAFASDGGFAASVGADKQLTLWEVAGPSVAGAWLAHDDDVWAVAFHPDRPVLATGAWDDRIRLWSLESDLLADVGAGGHVEGLAFAPDGKRLVAARAGASPALVVYDVKD